MLDHGRPNQNKTIKGNIVTITREDKLYGHVPDSDTPRVAIGLKTSTPNRRAGKRSTCVLKLWISCYHVNLGLLDAWFLFLCQTKPRVIFRLNISIMLWCGIQKRCFMIIILINKLCFYFYLLALFTEPPPPPLYTFVYILPFSLSLFCCTCKSIFSCVPWFL